MLTSKNYPEEGFDSCLSLQEPHRVLGQKVFRQQIDQGRVD